MTPTYTMRTTSAHDHNESVRAWTSSLPSGSDVASQGSDTVFDQAKSSRAETASIREMSAEIARPPGPRYSEFERHAHHSVVNHPIFSVYYQVYAEDGAIPSVNPVYYDDPYLGCISAQLITPPHTLLNLRNSLSGIEGVPENIATSLFISASCQTPMDDAHRVSLFEYPGLGCTPHEPIALVAKFSGEDRIELEPVIFDLDNLQTRGESPFERQYSKHFEGL